LGRLKPWARLSRGIDHGKGNTRLFCMGPFHGIEVSQLPNERYMLEDHDPASNKTNYLRRELLATVNMQRQRILEQMHIAGIWAFAADKHGKSCLMCGFIK
jgi:hypothetical protein